MRKAILAAIAACTIVGPATAQTYLMRHKIPKVVVGAAAQPSTPPAAATTCGTLVAGMWANDGAVLASGRTGVGTRAQNQEKARAFCQAVGKPGTCRANLDMDGKATNDGAWFLMQTPMYDIGAGHLYAAVCS